MRRAVPALMAGNRRVSLLPLCRVRVARRLSLPARTGPGPIAALEIPLRGRCKPLRATTNHDDFT